MHVCLTKEELSDYVISLRREFHQHPEVSMREDWTCGRICREMSALGIPYEIAGEKNVIGRLEFGEGRRIAFRSDFDALPVEETLDVPWKSRRENVMHACGHDGHTAALLGAARLLQSAGERLHGTVYLCFQQGEEVGRGAEECVEYLRQRGGVDMVIGAHLFPAFETGTIDVDPGLRAKGAGFFHIDITGKGGHGSRPDLVPNVLTMACDIYQHLISIPCNRFDAARGCVIVPCAIRAGERWNILPERAWLEGTIRFSSVEDGVMLMDLIRSTAEGIAAVHGGKASLDSRFASYPIINDTNASTLGQTAATICGLRPLHMPPAAISDNFAEFLKAFPGCFCFIGSRSARTGSSSVHHAANFDFDEAALAHMSRFFSACAEQLLLKS